MEISKIIPFLEENQSKIKIHFAIGVDNQLEPLYAFFEGKFKEWQAGQTRRNFERDYILSIIYMAKDEWLFAGIYKRINTYEYPEKSHLRGGFSHDIKYIYETKLLEHGKELIGKLVIKFNKNFRASYVNLENYVSKLKLCEIKREIYKVVSFPGYAKVDIQFDLLKEIINCSDYGWKTALSNVKGVYLITDKSNGKLYIGSAYGSNAFWQRWTEYVNNGHGNNKLLKEVINKNGISYSSNFTFSILEICNINSMDDEIIGKESFWKDRLLTRKFGYNEN